MVLSAEDFNEFLVLLSEYMFEFNVNGIAIGGRDFAVIGGPCSVESRDQCFAIAEQVAKSGARMFRGGAYKKILLGYWGSVLAAILSVFIAWWLPPIVLIPLLVTVVRRTRFKYRWADGFGKYLLIPIAHTLQLLSQSLGWLLGSRRT